VASAEEFVEFAEVMFPRLRRTAFLLCGNWHTAEDLAQTALAKMFVAWREIRWQDGAHAYANRTLVNAYLSHRRLKRTGELLTGWVPERPAAVCGAGDADGGAGCAGYASAAGPGGGGAAVLG
jgi:DNA-directed RNA polymerase specialized sigma24 family protein